MGKAATTGRNAASHIASRRRAWARLSGPQFVSKLGRHEPAALSEILIAGARHEEQVIWQLDLILDIESRGILRRRDLQQGETGAMKGIPGL